jgi:hypothetical protein
MVFQIYTLLREGDCTMRYLKDIIGLPVLLFLLFGMSMNACGMGSASWQEEVLLHDGSTIIVERTVSRGGRHELGQNPPIKEQHLSFAMPGTKRWVAWEDKFSEDVGSANFLPMLLDVQNDVTYLVASPMGCLSYNKWGRPNPPYVVFKYDGKAWQRIGLQELPAEIKTPNLIFSMPDIVVKKSGGRFMSVKTIQEILAGYKQAEYRTILRVPLKPGSPGVSCPDYSSPRYTSPKAPHPISPKVRQ